jgi:hypothetical protein
MALSWKLLQVIIADYPQIKLKYKIQGCVSGSGFNDFVDPDPYWESGSRGKKIKKFQWKNAIFSYF